jgi:hypothetical protein
MGPTFSLVFPFIYFFLQFLSPAIIAFELLHLRELRMVDFTPEHGDLPFSS